MRNQLFMAVPAAAWERIFGEKKEVCKDCKGTGTIGAFMFWRTGDWTTKQCETCKGTGKVKAGEAQ